jgi:predicted dehydrogenase
MNKIRFGIVGCGNAAVPVCEAIQASPLAEIAMACDVKLDLARDIGQRYGAAHTDQVAAVCRTTNWPG